MKHLQVLCVYFMVLLVYTYIDSGFVTPAFAIDVDIEECIGSGDAISYFPTESVEVTPVQEFVDNGDLIPVSSYYKLADASKLDDYINGQEWNVIFETGKISGYSGCSYKTSSNVVRPVDDLFVKRIYSGCFCSLDKTTWVYMGITEGSSAETWAEKTDYCRANCPKKCAQYIAENTNDKLTTMLENYAYCPIEQIIVCMPGTYLPANGVDSSDCIPCTENHWCPGGGFEEKDTDQGIKPCPENAISEPGYSKCICTDGYTSSGYTEWNSPVTTQTCKSTSVNLSYICDEESDIAGLDTSIPRGTAYTVLSNYHISNTEPETYSTTCTKYGNDFVSWLGSDGETYYGDEEIEDVRNDMTFTAVWTPRPTHTVTYYCGDGVIGTPESEVVPEHETYTVAENTCIKKGYNFIEWSSEHGSYNAGEEFEYNYDNDTEFKAIWEIKQIECVAGSYLPANSESCDSCPAGYYCPGDTFTFSENTIQGIKSCFTEIPVDSQVITSDTNSTSVNGCRVEIPAGSYLDIDTRLQTCNENSYCPGQTYMFNELSTLQEAINSGAAGIFTCPENSESNSEHTACQCVTGYVMNSVTSRCIQRCGSGMFLPDGAEECTAVGVGYYSADGESERHICPAGLTTSGFGVGADEVGDCGHILHVGGQLLHLRSERKTTPSLNVLINNDVYYGNMSTSQTNMNSDTDKKLHIKVDGIDHYVFDTTIE